MFIVNWLKLASCQLRGFRSSKSRGNLAKTFPPIGQPTFWAPSVGKRWEYGASVGPNPLREQMPLWQPPKTFRLPT